MSKAELPLGWCEPTAGTLKQYSDGIKSGLVPAGAMILRQAAEAITPQDVGSKEVISILGRMYEIVKAMRRAGRNLWGLAAPQIGERAQIALVPLPEGRDEVGYGNLMPVINPRIEPNSEGEVVVVGHGCFSSDQTSVRLAVPRVSTLSGLDHNGNEVHITRNDWRSAVDFHEVSHLDGIRPPDLAIVQQLPIDCVAPEAVAQYVVFVRAEDHTVLPIPEWHPAYPYEQWEAVRGGGFALSDYLE